MSATYLYLTKINIHKYLDKIANDEMLLYASFFYLNTTFRYRYGRDSATPPVDGSEANNTNFRCDVQLGDKDLIDIGEFFVFERPFFTKDNGKIIAEVKELNKKLKNGNLTKEQIVAVKQDRRKLKNRKYSFNGRQVI